MGFLWERALKDLFEAGEFPCELKIRWIYFLIFGSQTAFSSSRETGEWLGGAVGSLVEVLMPLLRNLNQYMVHLVSLSRRCISGRNMFRKPGHCWPIFHEPEGIQFAALTGNWKGKKSEFHPDVLFINFRKLGIHIFSKRQENVCS